eukprot:366018-Chlamydomonas_euryale.AAC.16
MTGLLTGRSRPHRQKTGFDGDPSHFDPVCELAIRVTARRPDCHPWVGSIGTVALGPPQGSPELFNVAPAPVQTTQG